MFPNFDASDAASLISTNSSDSSAPPSPSKRRRRLPPPLRLTSVGIDPAELVGKVLTSVRRSPNHPALTLDFSDNTTFQILVDGYDPHHRGVPKDLEMDPSLAPLFNAPNGSFPGGLTIVDCALVTLTDKAFERKEKDQDMWETQWDQNHLGVAFKFAGDGAWHCVWATLIEERKGDLVFRSYDDVYLEQLQRSPRKRNFHRNPSPVKKPQGAF